MEPEFWHERWRQGQIGFHEGRPNAYLARHVDRFATGSRVLVPLSGKAHDLAFLAYNGRAVLGVELSRVAVEAFFAEHEHAPTRSPIGPFERWSDEPIDLLVGDFFDLTPEIVATLGGVDALYDRAAIVALPEAMRRRYVAHLRSLMPRGSRGLVITFEYPQELMSGPPFSVSERELRDLYAGLEVTHLESAPAESARLRDTGAEVFERCFEVRF